MESSLVDFEHDALQLLLLVSVERLISLIQKRAHHATDRQRRDFPNPIVPTCGIQLRLGLQSVQVSQLTDACEGATAASILAGADHFSCILSLVLLVEDVQLSVVFTNYSQTQLVT